MARLYADENFKLAVVEELRRLGHDVLTVQEAGPLSAPCVFANSMDRNAGMPLTDP